MSAILPVPFNAHNVEPSSPGNQLPVSDSKGHLVRIIEAELKPTKNDPNQGLLELTLEVIDGEHKGATGPYRLNLFNNNPQAVDIANRQMSAICYVTNQMMVKDASVLCNIPFRAIVVAKTYKDANGVEQTGTEVKGVLDYQGNKPGKQGQTAPANQPAQQGWNNQPATAPAQPAAPAWGNPAQPAAPASAPAGNKPPWAQ